MVAGALTASAQDVQRFAAAYPEGPIFVGNKLYFAEMGADTVSVLHRGERRVFFQETGCGPTAIAPLVDGFAITCHLSGAVVLTDRRGVALSRVTRTDDRHGLVNPNDITPDGQGGAYFSDPGPFSKDVSARGFIVYLTRDGKAARVAGPLWYPNGVFYDGTDHTLYVSEHLHRRVLAYPVEANGKLGPMRVFADLNRLTRQQGAYREAGPDGIEKGPDGAFYVALYGEGRILKLSHRGELLGAVPSGILYVTNIAFSADGTPAIVGAHVNDRPPYRGELRLGPLPPAVPATR
jgi:gluconolactonase